MPFSPSLRIVRLLRPALWALALSAPVAAWATSATSAATSSASATTPATAGPKVQDISLIAGTCANCHGPDGRSTGGIPSLRGVNERHLLQRLQAFKAGTATDATVMTRLMKGYDDAQIQALAQWFSKEAN